MSDELKAVVTRLEQCAGLSKTGPGARASVLTSDLLYIIREANGLIAYRAPRKPIETGWLVEDSQYSKWWTGWPGVMTDSEFWTTDSLKAIRFARRWDAEEYVRLNMGDGDYRITEHQWG